MTDSVAKEFIIARTFAAPRQRVWDAWTKPEHLARWMGPAGTTSLGSRMDLRVGGTCHYGLRTPDGGEMWGGWMIREVVAPEKLVYVQHFADVQGGVTRHPMAPAWPLYMQSTITLAEQGEGTLLTIRWIPHEANAEEIATFNAAHDSMNQGWGGSLDKLALFVAGENTGQ